MKVSRYIATILLSLALVVTSAGVTAFATDTQDAGSADQQTILEEGLDPEDSAVEEQATAEEAVSEESGTDFEAIENEDSDAVEADGAGIQILAENINPLSDSQAGINSKVAKSLKGYRSILIAGIDNGGRADIILVFSYKKNSAKVFTVSRDTYMQLNDKTSYSIYGKKRDFCKCNQAAEFGGIDVLIRELNRHLDLNIREYIAVDWDTTATLIDTLGGVTVNVTNESMRQGINNMLPADNQVKGTGNQKLNGWQIVQYLRVRHYYQSDSDRKAGKEAGPRVREDRNRDFFIRLFNEVGKRMSVDDLRKVYAQIQRGLKTNMSIWDALSLVSSISVKSTPAFPYKYKTYWDPDGYFKYFVMNTNTSNVQTLHKNIFGQKKYKVTSTAKGLNTKTQKLVKKYLKKSQPLIKNANITLSSTEYTGSPIKPSVSIKLGDRTLIEGTDYKIEGLTARTDLGNYSFTVKGLISGYEGQSHAVSYSITPKGTSLASVKKGKKSFTASWNGQPALINGNHITGYQIQYSLKKNFSKAKTVSVAGYENQSTTVKKLKKKKTYYVRVRTYVTDSKGTYYSVWSGAKKVKTK